MASPIPPRARHSRRAGLHRVVARSLARVSARLQAVLRISPPGRWLHHRIHAYREISAVDVPLPRGAEGIDRLEIAFLSDLHAGLFMSRDDLLEIGRRVAALAPDLVCLGGDLINTRHEEMSLYGPLLDVLDPPLGIYAVPGNHEHFFLRGIESWTRFLEERGVRVLVNRGHRVERDGASLWICGVDDMTEGEPDLGAALDGRRPDEPALLLSHHPDLFIDTSDHIDLQLSGHTHGGQIHVLGWSPFTHSRHGFVDGLHRRNGAHLYVGRGAGVTAIPLRIGTRCEVPIVRLRTGAS